MRAVYTYWTGKSETVGFRSLSELASVWAYSLGMTRKQNSIDEVVLVTDNRGKEIVERYGLHFDVVDTSLEGVEIPYDLWAYPKIVAMAKQDVPFIHLDIDLFLIDQLTDKMINAPFCFQSEEVIGQHDLYAETLRENQWYLPKVIKDNPAKSAYNCAVVICNDLKLLKGWHEVVKEYIFNPENHTYHQNTTRQFQQNHIAEQYFLACLIDMTYKNVEFLVPDFDFNDFYAPDFKFVHLWSKSKEQDVYILPVLAMLERDFPESHKAIKAVNDSIVFSSIYENKIWGDKSSGDGSWDESTEFYRQRLGEIIKKRKIKSVVDLGCGYWGANRLVDWQGVKYTGIDVVDVVLEANRKDCDCDGAEFIYGNARTCDIPKCDLIIIKDVMIHWSNEQIIEFLGRDFPAKYILINNDVVGSTDVNVDIHTGHFRCVDLAKEPFSVGSLERDYWSYSVGTEKRVKALDLFKITKKKI